MVGWFLSFDKLYKTLCLICVRRLCSMVLTWIYRCFSDLLKLGTEFEVLDAVWVFCGALSIFPWPAGA